MVDFPSPTCPAKNDVFLLITCQYLINSFCHRMLDVNVAKERVAGLRLREHSRWPLSGCAGVKVGHEQVGSALPGIGTADQF